MRKIKVMRKYHRQEHDQKDIDNMAMAIAVQTNLYDKHLKKKKKKKKKKNTLQCIPPFS